MLSSEITNEELASRLFERFTDENGMIDSAIAEAAHRLRTMIPVPQVQVYHGPDGTYVRVCGKPITKVDSYEQAVQIKEAIDAALTTTTKEAQ